MQRRARPGKPQTTGRRPAVAAKRAQPAAPRPILKTVTKFTARMLLGLVILAIFIFGVFPTGSYVEQRNELRDAEEQLSDLETENSLLEARVARLESDEEIERVAREEFNMGYPDEESYLILPPGE